MLSYQITTEKVFMSLFADDFARELQDLLATAEKCGFVAVEVNAGNLQRRLDGHSGVDHRTSVCCDVMRLAMGTGDIVVNEPPHGEEASLVIRYHFPRPRQPSASD